MSTAPGDPSDFTKQSGVPNPEDRPEVGLKQDDTDGGQVEQEPTGRATPFDLPPRSWIPLEQIIRLQSTSGSNQSVFSDSAGATLLVAGFVLSGTPPPEPTLVTPQDLAAAIVAKVLSTQTMEYGEDIVELLRPRLLSVFPDDHPLVRFDFDQQVPDDRDSARYLRGTFLGDRMLAALKAAWRLSDRSDGQPITFNELVGGFLMAPGGASSLRAALPDDAIGALDAFVLEGELIEFLASRPGLARPAEAIADEIRTRWLTAQGAVGGDNPAARTLAAFDPDRVDFARRIEPTLLRDDPLGRAPDALAMAELICHRNAPLPLAIGLFGNWGSGKSTFMGMLEAAINRTAELGDKVRDQGQPAFVQNVVHIRFNAWHYADQNLWASIGTHIFEQLVSQASERKNWLQHLQLNGLIQRLETVRSVEDTAATTIDDTEKRKTRLREDIEALETQIALKKDAIKSAAGTALKQVLADGLDQRVREASAKLGLKDVTRNVDDIRAGVAELQTFSGRAGRFLGSLLADPTTTASWAVFGFALAILLLVAGDTLALSFPHLTALKSAVAELAGIAGIAASAIAYLMTYTNRVKPLFDAYEKIERDESAALATARAEQARLESEIRTLEIEVGTAREQMVAAEEERRELEAMRDGKRPGKLLTQYIQSRASGDDYRQHLGLVSMLSRDFKRMSELMDEQRARRDSGAAAQQDLPSIDRIVLYIDDLDRCSPEVVVRVLEAVHLILAYPLFVVVVGVDPRWLERALKSHHRVQLGTDEAEASARDYLEKIFQIPYQLLPPTADGDTSGTGSYNRLVKSILGPAPATGTDGLSTGRGGRTDDDARGPGEPITALTPVPLPLELDVPTDVLSADEVETILARVTLTQEERACIAALGGLIGHSPRMTKRVVNLYRVIRARWPEADLDRFLGTNDPTQASFQALMLKLALDASFDDEKLKATNRLILEQEEHARFWEALLWFADYLDEKREKVEERTSDILAETLTRILSDYPNLDTPDFSDALRQVGKLAYQLEQAAKNRGEQAPNLLAAYRGVFDHHLVAPYRF